ncbi:MAG: TIM barrel protein [Chloroflexi bacterium]|nr:TIM barrel protein [Chloroflexota bacterium]MDA1228779.1 TIM barrel protein [Chloroflexota bacterium]
MIYGAITNSWRQHLADHDLTSLVAEAKGRGAKHIELRQTCLGDCETGEGENWRPVMANLQTLVSAYPDLTFNLAMAWPCLSKSTDAAGEQFQAALEAAKLVNPEAPHLRIVDPTRFEKAWETPDDIPAEAMSLVDMTREAARQQVTFSIENSGQPIRSMELLVKEIRSRLSEDEGARLGICTDATNQLRGYPDSDPVGEIEALPLDMIKIVHFKQARNGQAIPTVDTGDVDCARMQRVLTDKGYQGAAIMEIPPHDQVFENLSASYSFLNAAATNG